MRRKRAPKLSAADTWCGVILYVLNRRLGFWVDDQKPRYHCE